jgi:hypothetical protein
MSKNRNQGPQTRERAARTDGHVGPLQRNIESVYGLPAGSVQIVDPNSRRNIRDDAKIGSVRRRTE